MSFKDLKDKLYYYIVEKNSFIKRDYEGYVNNNLEEHRRNRLKSWLLLIKLSFYYRILRKSKPYFNNQRFGSSRVTKLPYLDGAESEISNRRAVNFFAKELCGYDIISFDIFDTLIFRPFAHPWDLFMIVGYKLKCPDFMRIRREAEKEARENAKDTKGNTEVTIYDIYQVVERLTGIPKEKGIAVELETEMEFCFPNPYMQKIYNILLEQGKTIIITSDMYIPEVEMKKILLKCEYKNYSKLFVSCDYNCSKRDTGLYDLILRQFDINEKKLKLVHIGDNYSSDIQAANSVGIETRYYKNVHEIGNKYRADGMSQLVGSIYAGIVNTHLHNGIKKYNVYYEYGFIYGGLYVLGFCNWLYRKVKQENIDKILFLSRDGDIYIKVFRELFPEIPAEYVFWSRIANVKYAADINRGDFFNKLIKHRANAVTTINVGDLLRSISLDKFINYLPENGLSAEEVLTTENVNLVENFFIKYWHEITETYTDEKKILGEIFKSIIGNNKVVAVVDVGWIGSGPKGIKYLIEEVWKIDCEVRCYVAASRHWSKGGNIIDLMNNEIEPYIFSEFKNRIHYDFHSKTNKGTNNLYFELFTQACHPSFSGVTEEGKYCFDIPEVENYGIVKDIQKGIIDFSKIYYKLFKNYSFTLNISGYDSYCPFRMIIKDLKFLKKYFYNFRYSRSVTGDHKNQTFETLGEIMEQVNL